MCIYTVAFGRRFFDARTEDGDDGKCDNCDKDMNAPDPERTALVLETLGALSYQNLVDKHIGTVLHYKVASDPVAIENIIYIKTTS